MVRRGWEGDWLAKRGLHGFAWVRMGLYGAALYAGGNTACSHYPGHGCVPVHTFPYLHLSSNTHLYDDKAHREPDLRVPHDYVAVVLHGPPEGEEGRKCEQRVNRISGFPTIMSL